MKNREIRKEGDKNGEEERGIEDERQVTRKEDKV